MRYFYTFLFLFLAFMGHTQPNKKTSISGIIITNDSVAVPDVSIINTRTMETVKTNSKGFFQTTIEVGDSLLVHHISFKRRFINEKNNGHYIIIEPENYELDEVDIMQNDYEKLKKNLGNVGELARQKKLSKEEIKSSTQRTTEQNGSHNKGFSQVFGPSIPLVMGKVVQMVNNHNEKQYRKKITSNYHLVKKKSVKKKE